MPDLKIKIIENKETWDNFVTSQDEHTFLQSWAWGELNEAVGDSVWRLGIYDGDKLIAATLVIKVHARRGNFLFVPHGPVFTSGEKITNNQETRNKQILNYKPQILNELTNYLKNLAKEEGDIVFIRISPLLEENEENKKMFRELGFRDAPIYMHAETTWQVDLDKNEEDLMMDMRKNTRNLIRQAQRKNVEIISGTSDEFIREFLKLYKTTAKHQGFIPFSDKYIKEEIAAFAGEAKIYLAKYKGKTLSTALIPAYGHSAFYHHGANSMENRKIPSAYLLQWQAMLDAKEQERTHYNFWGIAKNDKNKKHPWYGLTFFKQSFGGYRKDYLHAQDMPLSSKYWLNWIVEKFRLWRRGV